MEFLFLGFSLIADGYVLCRMLESSEKRSNNTQNYPKFGQNYAEYKRKFSKKRKKVKKCRKM